MTKIEKIKPKQTETIESTRQRVFRFVFVLLLAWVSLYYLPKPNDYPPPKLEKMEFFQISQLGDISIFNLLVQEIIQKAEDIKHKIKDRENIDEVISTMRHKLEKMHQEIYESNIEKMKISLLDRLVNQNKKLLYLHLHANENVLNQFVSWFLNQTVRFITKVIHSQFVELVRSIIDPTLPFFHATIGKNYDLEYLDSPQGRQRNQNLYVKNRLPEALEQEVKKTWYGLENIERQLEDINKQHNFGELSQKTFLSLVHQLHQDIDSLLVQHQIIMNSEVILWINSANEKVTFSHLYLLFLLKFSQILARLTIIFEHLIQDELIFEILVIYFVFLLTILNDRFNYWKGEFFKVLYIKATFTSIVTKTINNLTRSIDILNDFSSFILIQLKQCSFSDFNKYINSIKKNAFSSFHQSLNKVKIAYNLITNLLLQPLILFKDKTPSPISNFDRFFRDIRIFRDQILFLKMVLQYPYFLHEHHSVELAYDVIVDGLPPNLDEFFNKGEDAKRFTNQYKVLARKLTFLKLEELSFYLKSKSILLHELDGIEGLEKNIFKEKLIFINEKLPIGKTKNNGDIPTDIRKDIEIFAKQVNIFSELINVFEIHYECANWAVKTFLLDIEQIGYRDPYSEFIRKKTHISLGVYITVLLASNCLLIDKLLSKFDRDIDSYHTDTGWSILLEDSKDILDSKRSRLCDRYLEQGMVCEEANERVEKEIESLTEKAIKRNNKKYIPSKTSINNFKSLLEHICSTRKLPKDIENCLKKMFELMIYLGLKPIHFRNQYKRILGYCYVNEAVVTTSDLFNEDFASVIQPQLINFFIHLRPRILIYKAWRDDVTGTIVKFLLSDDLELLFKYFNNYDLDGVESEDFLDISKDTTAFLNILLRIQHAQLRNRRERDDISQALRM